MTKNNKRLVEYFITVLVVFIIIFVFSFLERDTFENNITNCYNIIGKENITKESWDDWSLHAYINETLVCAHGVINSNGLKEEIVYRPFPTIIAKNLT